jgi:alpha-L-rhamnosidase
MNGPKKISQAHWIWSAQQNVLEYNIAARFRKTFITPSQVDSAHLLITADSRYRVFINGHWINDGPGKAYPEHWTYDAYDILPLLKTGNNLMEVTVRYYGVGTFHQIPQQAGLLAEIQIDESCMGTDATWDAMPLKTLRQHSPKVSVQMEPTESMDARLDVEHDWQPAVAHFEAKQGPWKDLTLRRTEALSKIPCRPVTCEGVNLVPCAKNQVCVPVTRIAHPGVIEANHYTSRPVILTAILSLKSSISIAENLGQWKVSIQGQFVSGQKTLEAGEHAVMFFCDDFFSHRKELEFPYLSLVGTQWNDWQVFVHQECLFVDNDRHWLWFENDRAEQVKASWQSAIQELASLWTSPEQDLLDIAQRVAIPLEELFLENFSQDFADRQPQPLMEPSKIHASALCVGQQGKVTLKPHEGHDLELCYDFGEQRCGYIDFSIVASAGTIMDLHMVEYITPEGVVQHTVEFNRNGLRYIAQAGENVYTSLKRRSGRYLFITLRNVQDPVSLERLQIIESTAAVKPIERFHCSDPNLNSIWDICERTLKMGMEDVFTDCSLYEQTLWIGDARNEALYAFNIYGNYDVSARSLELGAQSLEHLPMVGCQVPSSWDCLIPAWSFLWGLHTWEHYFHSGDLDFLRTLWPAIQKNLDGAQTFIDPVSGLFSAQLWNLLEWAPIDHEHATVIHNSILFAGALRAGEKCAQVLNDSVALQTLSQRREKLVTAIHQQWDESKGSYPDAILENGLPSAQVCQHNSALALMCDIMIPEHLEAAKNNLLHPSEGMTEIASPFAAQFHFEGLELLGEYDAIMNSIRHNYTPMIEAGATTAWETFPGSTCSPEGFPTRSHCHGWSCGPLQFFNRIVLGIRQTSPGGLTFEISPWVNELEHASGAMATPLGVVSVEWKKQGNALSVRMDAPAGVKTVFVANTSHESYDAVLEML